MMISLFELGHVDPIPINFVFVPSFMCRVCVYIYMYKKIKLMPGANPLTTVISALFFLDGQCQAWTGTPCASVRGGGGGQWEEEVAAVLSWLAVG